MNAVIASVIAVLGTLLGAGVTHLFQLRTAERAERSSRAERLRQERLAAYSAYAGALLDYRRVLVQRWHVIREERHDEDTSELREDTYRMRYAAQQAMFRAQLITADPALVRQTEEMLELFAELHKVHDRTQLDQYRAATREGIRTFISASAVHAR